LIFLPFWGEDAVAERLARLAVGGRVVVVGIGDGVLEPWLAASATPPPTTAAPPKMSRTAFELPFCLGPFAVFGGAVLGATGLGAGLAVGFVDVGVVSLVPGATAGRSCTRTVIGSVADSTEITLVTVSKPGFVIVKVIMPGSTPTTFRPSLVVVPKCIEPCETSSPSGSVTIWMSLAKAVADALSATATTAQRRLIDLPWGYCCGFAWSMIGKTTSFFGSTVRVRSSDT
jgi:hypothetical protein